MTSRRFTLQWSLNLFPFFAISSDPAPFKTWSSEKLKTFLRDQGVSTNGRKNDLLDRTISIHSQSVAEASIDRQSLNIPQRSPFGAFDGLPKEGWGRKGFHEIGMHLVPVIT